MDKSFQSITDFSDMKFHHHKSANFSKILFDAPVLRHLYENKMRSKPPQMMMHHKVIKIGE